MTWPLVVHLSDAVADPGDSLVLSWVLDWDYYATVHARPLFDANIFYPAHLSLAFSEHMYGIALLFFPLFAAGVSPIAIQNVALLLGFALSGYLAYALGRYATNSTAAGVIGGIAYAFVGMRFHQLGHLPYVWSVWLPLILLTSIKLLREPGLRAALLLALALVLNGLTALHWFAFGTFTAAATIGVCGFAMRRRDSRFWMFAAVVFAIEAVLLAPFLLPYRAVAEMYGMQRSYAEVLPSGARWRDWFAPNLQSKLYRTWSAADSYGHERTLFPGLVTFALAAAALLPYRKPQRPWLIALDIAIAVAAVMTAIGAMAGDVTFAIGSQRLFAYSGSATPLVIALVLVATRLMIEPLPAMPRMSLPLIAAVIWLVCGAWGSRGLSGALHSFLFSNTTVFRGIRMPTRWVMVAYTGLGVLVSIGADRLLARRSTRAALAVVLACAMLFELRAAPIRWYMLPTETHDVYRWLNGLTLHGGIVELPMTQSAAYEYLSQSTHHHQRLINGVSSFTPPHYVALQALYDASPIPSAFLSRLERLRCALVIVHADALGAREGDIRAWLRDALASDRLTFVRKFDADYVFATRLEPHAARWTNPSNDLDTFLAGAPTFRSEPFSMVEFGPAIGTTRGRLVVAGWALAPAGITRVNLRFANGHVVIPAERVPRADIKQRFPWYPHDPLPGFTKAIEEPPPGVGGDTDMQVEIIDARGKSVRFPPFWFRWLAAPQQRITWKEPQLNALLRRLNADNDQMRARLLSGSASIHDLMPNLLTDTDIETDSVFTARVFTAIFGAPPDRMDLGHYLAMLNRGTSRERVIYAMFSSSEFQQTYIRSGHVVID